MVVEADAIWRQTHIHPAAITVPENAKTDTRAAEKIATGTEAIADGESTMTDRLDATGTGICLIAGLGVEGIEEIGTVVTAAIGGTAERVAVLGERKNPRLI